MHQSSCCKASSDARRKRSTSPSSSRIRALRCESCARCCESGAPCCEFCTSVSATGHHDLLREDEVADFLAVVPRLEDAELDDFFAAGRRLGGDSLEDDFFAAGRRLGDDSLEDDFFAAGRGRLGDDSLEDDFLVAGRDRLDVVALGADFFAGRLAAGADADPRSES